MGNNPPSESQTEEFFRILQKDLVDITDSQKIKLQSFVTQTVNYNPNTLSLSVRKLLFKHYAYLEYGAFKISNGGDSIIQLEKGEVAEPDAIRLLSKLDGVEYVKNDEKFTNRYFKGVPDIVLRENNEIVGVKEIKIPLDLPSYLERYYSDEPLQDDKWELLAYMDVLGLKEGEICYCLVDMPDEIRDTRLEQYKQKLKALGVKGYTAGRKVKQLEIAMRYDYFPEEKKVKRFTLQRKGYFTKQAHERVKLVRKMLNRLHEKIQNNGVALPEIAEPLQESID